MGLFNRTGRTTRHESHREPAKRSRFSAESLMKAAGLAADRTGVEALEARQLLFTLTVTADDVDPATGLGTVQAAFGYVLPWLQTKVERPDQAPTPQSTAESFNDKAYGQYGSGAFFPDSNIQIIHNGVDAAVEGRLPPGDTQDNNARYLRLDLPTTGDSVSFRFFGDVDQQTGRRPQRVASTVVLQITGVSQLTANGGVGVVDPTGLVLARHRVELLFRDQVLASFTGAALGAAARFAPAQGTNPANGVGTFTFAVPNSPQQFDTIRIVATGDVAPGSEVSAFAIDSMSYSRVQPTFKTVLDPLITGAGVTLSGPVGASVTITDLYGNDMQRTMQLGALFGSDLLLVDLNDDGIPDFNNGIGAVRLSGVDSRSTLSMWGLDLEETDTQTVGVPFFEQGVSGKWAAITGNFDGFESAGFGYGYNIDPDGTVNVTGLPDGPGALVLGSPFLRDLTRGAGWVNGAFDPGTVNPFGPAGGNLVTDGFNRSSQGVFVENGQSIGSVNIAGVVHGSSHVSGSIQQFSVAYMVGTLTVDGDLGTFTSGTDAGMWAPDPDFAITNPNVTLEPVYKTAGQLIVGRTVGQFMSAGRNLMDVTVVGDLNAPNTRPPRSTFVYSEIEHVLGINTDTDFQNSVTINLTDRSAPYGQATTDVFRNNSQAAVFGSGYFRNDTLSGAEYVGSASTGVRIRGEISGLDNINTGEDKADVYAFSTDGSSEIFIQGVNASTGFLPYFRVVDQRGRTVAAPQGADTEGDIRRFDATTIRFTPTDGPGVYYLVVQDPTNDNTTTDVSNLPYSIVLTGMAATTMGAYRTGGGSGFASGNTSRANTVTVMSGSVGSIRVGMGFVDNTGADADPTDTYNTAVNVDDSTSFMGGVYTTPGTIYNVTAGGDIGVPNGNGTGRVDIRAGGDFGSLVTGLNPVVAGGVGDGDVNFLYFDIGGNFGSADISGGVGMDQDSTGDPRGSVGPTGGLSIITGRAGHGGSIGSIRTGFHVISDQLRMRVPTGSVIGQLLVSQDAYGDTNPRSGIYDGTTGVPITSAIGSDVRFVDFPRLSLQSTSNHTFPIVGSQGIEFVDDGGVRFRVEVTNAPDGVNVGTIRVLPINGSLGVALGQISVDLSNGRGLRITPLSGTASDVLSLGRIIVTNAGPGSTIEFGAGSSGPQVDVYRIDINGAVDSIINHSIGGDILTVDAIALGSLELEGDLGFTQTVPWGPKSYAVRLGITGDGPSQDLGTPMGVELDAGVTVDNDFNGEVYRPINDDTYGGGTAYLDDLGMPLDEIANGLVLRTGNLTNLRVRGSVGDVVLQDGNAAVTEMTINSDHATPFDGFDGLRGVIYAFNVDLVDVGDGIARAPVGSPIGTTGIFAANNIREVRANATNGTPLIAGNIIAANVLPRTNTAEVLLEGQADGIDLLAFNNAFIDDVHITSSRLEDFWRSYRQYEERQANGDIDSILLPGGRVFRSSIFANNIEEVRFQGGTWDATSLTSAARLGTVQGDNIRNSTLAGDPLEFRVNQLVVAQNIGTITVLHDIADLTVSAIGSVERNISAVNMIRGTYGINGIVHGVNLTGDMRAVTFGAGEIESNTITGNITGSTISIAGALQNLTVNSIRNSLIEVTGPAGQIGTITTVKDFHGEVRSTGPVGTLTSTTGSVNLKLTTTGSGGNVQTIGAAQGDVILDADIAGSIASITAGRNIGSMTDRVGAYILSRQNIGTVSAPNGQLYTDVRASGTIGTVTLGRASSKPEANRVGHGSIIAQSTIQSVTLAGDFGGDIISYTGGIGNISMTGGSFYPGRLIAAYDGSIQSLSITGGDLLADVYADYDIASITVAADAGRVFGNVGIDPSKSQFTTVAGDANRNQLPAGVGQDAGIQGPRIQAGRDIRSVTIAGSVYEAGFVAGRDITSVQVSGRIANDQFSSGRKGSYFVAGDNIVSVTTGVSAADTLFLAGVTDLGADNKPGGIGTNKDTVKAGNIGTLGLQATFGVAVLAGVEAGSDGVYATTDDTQSLGRSSITTLTVPQTVSNTQVSADVLPAAVKNDGRFANGPLTGSTSWRAENRSKGVDADAAIPGTSFSGTQSFVSGSATYTFTFSGPGTAVYNAGSNRLTLRNTTSASTLTIASSTGFIDGMTVLSNDEASLGTLTLSSTLRGATTILIDAGIGTVNANGGSVFARTTGGAIDAANTPRITTGGDVSSFTASSWSGGYITARAMGAFRVNGVYGGAPESGEATLQVLSLGSASITGAMSAMMSIDRDSGAISVTGAVDRSQIRVGGSLSSLTTGAMSQTVVGVYDTLGNVTIAGQMFDSSIAGGVDLGTDAAFDGTGSAADRVSTGFIGSVQVNGDFRESDITAGLLRGADKFFGTRDDAIAAGRSTIGAVTITGSNVGSTRASESYRISSSGTIGTVRVGGQTFTGSRGNFSVETRVLPPVPVRVTDLSVDVQALVYTASLTFNQPMDISSLDGALSVSEVRGTGDVEVRLIEGVDYTLSYIEGTNTLNVTFARDVVTRNLPITSGLPGPGVFRFRLSDSLTRGRLTHMPLDGDANGVIEVEDTYSQDMVVGDAGDKLTPLAVPFVDGYRVDLYGPASLDFVFDNDRNPDGLPDPNRTLTISGAIGDHPDNDANHFRFAGDVDLYSITLQAGQILQLSSLSGAAFAANVSLLDAQGNVITFVGNEAAAVSLPSVLPEADAPVQTQPQSYLIRTTGTYIIAVGDTSQVTGNSVNDRAPAADGELGAYSLSFTIFDDGDTGFTAATNAGDGAAVVNAPAPISFAGLDGVLGTSDDASSIVIADFTFTYNAATGTVSGTNGAGISSTTTASGVSTSVIQSAIGPSGVVGAFSSIASDVDVFHLNNRQAINPGTKFRATVRLTDLGADLGSQAIASNSNNRGSVQFGLFDTSNSLSVDDATVVFSPSQFLPYGGTPNTVLADNGSTKYGFDSKGDFYIEFVTPEKLGAPGQAGTFALYMQGVVNSPYEIELTTLGTGTTTKHTQNFYIETAGGSVNWLEAGGLTTKLAAFNPSLLGFTGTTAAGQPVGEYVLGRMTATLNALFQSTGLDVNFSTNPADFEFQPFSTIYLSNANDPINQIFKAFQSFNIQNLGIFNSFNSSFVTTQPFGASEHSDPFNTDLQDEAVVFAPAFAVMGLTPRQTDIDQFVIDLSGAIARRAGELMGLRISTDNVVGNAPVTTFDPQAADSVTNAPTGAVTYTLSDQNRALSDAQDSIESTDFFLGRQRALSLLNQIVARQ